MFEFELVQAIPEHAKLIMQWRNDPETLAQSFHAEPKVWETFYPEFLKNYFCFPDLPALFVLQGSERIAFLKFDPVEDFMASITRKRRSCSISINVAPTLRGKGYGSTILEAIKPIIKLRGYEVLFAEVKIKNERSSQAFLHAGYESLGESLKILEDGSRVPIVRYATNLSIDTNTSEQVYIIAEAGSNWRIGNEKQSKATAKALIYAAAEARADAIKFQVFRPEKIYVKNAGSSNYLAKNELNEDMETLFSRLVMPYEMIEDLAQECQKLQIAFMATPFSEQDFAAVDPYVTRHKIASYELNHIHLLELAAKSQKPLLLSTGASTEDEIAWAVNAFQQFGGKDLTLLQCTANYSPAPPKSMHLNTIPWLMQRFHVKAGLSDHSGNPLSAPLAAVALGASVIEKHFTLDRSLPGPDHIFSIIPLELKALIEGVREVEEMKGSYCKIVDPAEHELRDFARRGIQAITDIPEGSVLHENENFAILRPGNQRLGLHSKFISEIEGRLTTRFISLGEGIQKEDYR